MLRFFLNPVECMLGLRRQYGDVSVLCQGGNEPLIFRSDHRLYPTVFALGESCNREVLTQPNLFESDVLRGPKEFEWLSKNMVSANRENRAQQRHMMMPGFQRDHLKKYYDVMVAYSEEMMSGWREEEKIDLVAELDELAANTGSKAFYGLDPQAHHQDLARLSRRLGKALISPITMLPINIPGSPYWKFLRLAQEVNQAVIVEIERKRAAGCDGDDILSIMIKSHDEGTIQLTDADLVGNTFALYLAGTDIPANGLCMMLFALAQHPEAMADLLDELESSLGGRPPSFEEIWKLPVLDRVFRESLRLFCPAVLQWRKLTDTAMLGGYELEKGSEVLLSPYVTHVDSDLYPQPRRYDPSRWENVKPSAFAYLPFGYGARRCLGAAFAEMLLKIALSVIIQKYRLQIIPGTRIDIKFTNTMKPKQGLPVIVHRQDRQFYKSRGPVRGYIRKMVELE